MEDEVEYIKMNSYTESKTKSNKIEDGIEFGIKEVLIHL